MYANDLHLSWCLIRLGKPNKKRQRGHDNNEQAERGQAEKFDLLKLLFDPEDHVQTVENFFDFAFLIKVRTYYLLLVTCYS